MNRLKAILTIVVIATGFYVGYKVLPVYFANFTFQDFLDSQVRTDVYGNHSDVEVREIVMKKARESDIPLKYEGIKVIRSGGAGGVAASESISADYTVHVDLPLYPLDLHFHPHSGDSTKF